MTSVTKDLIIWHQSYRHVSRCCRLFYISNKTLTCKKRKNDIKFLSLAKMSDPLWLSRFKAAAPPSEVAKAWFEALSEEKQRASEAKDEARAELRRSIVAKSSESVEIQRDAAKGYVYTAAILRAADVLLGIPPAKATGKLRGAASGDGAPIGPRCVIEGGEPGTLGLWWSDFQTASRPFELLELGITHRLNMAAEVAKKFPDENQEPQIIHVPMRDAFSNEKAGCEFRSEISQLLAKTPMSSVKLWNIFGAIEQMIFLETFPSKRTFGGSERRLRRRMGRAVGWGFGNPSWSTWNGSTSECELSNGFLGEIPQDFSL